MKTKKICKICLIDQPMSKFRLVYGSLDGHSCKCEECTDRSNKESWAYTHAGFQPPPTPRDVLLKKYLDSINMTEEEYMCKSVPDQNKINFEAKICNI